LNTPFNDIEAFKVIFTKYFNPLVNFVHSRYLKDREIARDIIQTTFTVIWEKRSEIVISSSIKSYLFQAAKNKALDCIRSNPGVKTDLQDGFRDFDIIDAAFDKDVHSTMVREFVEEIVKNMKPVMKEIFILNKSRGFSYEEIAAKRKISKRTVESNMARAFKMLRRELKNTDLFDPQ